MTTTTVRPVRPRLATRPQSRAGAFRAAVRSEFIKLRSVRSTTLFVALAAFVGAAMTVVLGRVVETDPYDHLPFTIGNTFLVSSWLTTLFAVVAGTLLFTSEVQHGTLGVALTLRPSRATLVAAKTVTAAVLGLTMGAAGIVSGLAAGFSSGMDGGDMSGAVAGAAWALVLTTTATVLGLGVGLIVRHGAAAVTTVLVWALAVETLVRGIIPPGISRFLPFTAAHGLLGTRSAADTPETLAVALSNIGNAAVIVGWATVLVAVGTTLLHRTES
jgi:ABC-2 type transport system permease protein